MSIGSIMQRMCKGLVLHYLQRRTVEDAVRAGREAGLPDELLASLPGMMFEATSAACAVHLGAKTRADVLDTLVERGAPREDVGVLIDLALDFIAAIAADGDDRPMPASTEPWFAYPG